MDEVRFFKPRAVRKYQGNYPPPPAEPQSHKYMQFRYKYNSVEYAELFSDFKNKVKVAKKVATVQDGDSFKYSISYWQYQVITLSLQYNPFKVFAFADLYMYYGCWIVLLSYIFISFVVAMPLYFIVFFLGYYSKQKYMTFWLSLPLLKGTGFAIALINLIHVLYNMAFSSLALYFSITWLMDSSDYCEKSVADPRCESVSYSRNCSEKKLHSYEKSPLVFPTLNLLYDNIDSKEPFSTNVYWILCNILLWMIILLQILHKPTMNVMLKCNGFMWIFVIIISVIFAFAMDEVTVPLSVLDINNIEIQEITFWTKLIVHACQEVLPGDVMTYASKIKKEVKPTVEAVVMFIIRCLMMIIISNWIVYGTIGIVNKYKLIDTLCIRPDGINTIFAIMPELMRGYTTFSRLLIPVYFLVISYWALESAFYSVNGFLEALHDQLPKISKFQYLCLGIIWVLLILNNALLNNRFKYFFYVHRHARMYALYLMMCVAIFIILYTPKRIINDYQFTFGIRIGIFWRELMKFYIIILFIAGLSYSVFVFQETRFHILVYELVLLNVVLAPILFCVVAKTISYKTKKSKFLVKPDYLWGPPTEEMREARRNFNAKLRLSESMVCNHDCVLNSPYLNLEVNAWLNRAKYFDEWYFDYMKSLQTRKKLK